MNERFTTANKKLLGVLCLASALTLANAPVNAATLHPALNINQIYVTLQQPLQIINNVTYVPLKSMNAYLEVNTQWDQATKTVTLTKAGKTIKCTLNSKTVYVDGVAKTITSPVLIINGTTYVPARFISDIFGFGILYDKKANAIMMTVPSLTQEHLQEIIKKEDKNIYATTIKNDLKPQSVSNYGSLFTGTFAKKVGTFEKLENIYIFEKKDLPLDIGDSIIYAISLDKVNDKLTVKFKPKDNRNSTLSVYLSVPNEGMKRVRDPESTKENSDGTITCIYTNTYSDDVVRFPNEKIGIFKYSKVGYFCLRGNIDTYAIKAGF